SETAGQHLDRVEGALLDRGQGRVGLVFGVARAPVERADAATKLGILTDGCMLVEHGDRAGQSGGINAALTREFLERPAALEVSRSNVGHTGMGNGFDMPNG